MTISNRERFKAIARFQRPGDYISYDMIWGGTLSNWVQQGAPAQLAASGQSMGDRIYGNSFFRKYFDHGTKHALVKVKSGVLGSEELELRPGFTTNDGCPLIPHYKAGIISEDDQSITFTSGGGQTMKALKSNFAMPMFLDWPVKDRKTWNEHKKKLDPFTPERWPVDWDAYVKEMNGQDDPVVLEVGGFYGYLREWVGSEKILYMFYDDPGLIEDMMETMLNMELEIMKRVLKDIKVDEADFWEDMAYKSGPFISPAMVRKFMMPRYKKITDLLRSHGVDIVYVDCDGNMEQLVPLWLESGVNYMWPLEQAAGNDAVALRKKYGKNLILGGGIDKRALIKGKEAIKTEVMSKVPFLFKDGGYFPTVDHLVPPGVTFENYCYYINLLREVAGFEKLSF